jgi:mRNA interferase RelE/StbE
MLYKVIIERQAHKKLLSLSSTEKARIAEKVYWLGLNPDAHNLDVKKLAGVNDYYRLRVGDWRLIFRRQSAIKVLIFEKVKARGDAYK